MDLKIGVIVILLLLALADASNRRRVKRFAIGTSRERGRSWGGSIFDALAAVFSRLVDSPVHYPEASPVHYTEAPPPLHYMDASHLHYEEV